MITTLKDFILRIESLNNISDAYEVFEDATCEEVRSFIYRISDPLEAEPFRAAMHRMGYKDF